LNTETCRAKWEASQRYSAKASGIEKDWDTEDKRKEMLNANEQQELLHATFSTVH